jgi:transcriptional regulator with XRE-family HTH domain
MTRQDAKTPSPVDVRVGSVARRRRLSFGMSQAAVAALLGVTFQQLQKYESGSNRISASRLHAIAHALKVSVGFLFDTDASAAPRENVDDLYLSSEALRLNRAFIAIDDAHVRSHVVELVQSIADSEGGDRTTAKPLPRRNGTAADH